MTLFRGSKTGQTPLTFVFTLLGLNLAWIFFLSKMFAYIAESSLSNGAIGFELFFFSNMNLWFFLVQLIAIFAYGFWGNKQ